MPEEVYKIDPTIGAKLRNESRRKDVAEDVSKERMVTAEWIETNKELKEYLNNIDAVTLDQLHDFVVRSRSYGAMALYVMEELKRAEDTHLYLVLNGEEMETAAIKAIKNDRGVYKEYKQLEVEHIVTHYVMNSWFKKTSLTPTAVKDTVYFMKHILYRLGRVADKSGTRIYFANGYADGNIFQFYKDTEKTFYPHVLIPRHISMTLKPNEKIDTILTQILGDGKEEFLEAVGAGLAASNETQIKVIFLEGIGANGKTVLLELLRNCFGEQNCASVSFTDILTNRFALNELNGKLFNLVSEEMQTEQTGDLAVIKRVTGGGRITVEEKFKPRYQTDIFTTHIFAVNVPPAIDTADFAFWRRVKLFHCPNIFVSDPDPQNPHEYKADPTLLSKITDEDYDYLATLLMKHYLMVKRENKTVGIKEALQTMEAYGRSSDVIQLFIDECLEFRYLDERQEMPDPTFKIQKQELYEAYTRWYTMKRLPGAVGRNQFYEDLERNKGFELKKNRGYYYYIGVAFKTGVR